MVVEFSVWEDLILLILSVCTLYWIMDMSVVFKPIPVMLRYKYWGLGKPKKSDDTIKPYKITFSEPIVEDLKRRLIATRFIEPLEEMVFEYGFNGNILKKVIQFWSNKYDFSKRENYLNQYSHYTTNIQGLDIHFVHVKPQISDTDIKIVPLLLLHDWSGTVCQFYKCIPMLINPKYGEDTAFELIIPSLPGFGLSEGSLKPEFGTIQTMLIIVNLMDRLGYEKYYVHGGGWGSEIGSYIATYYPDKVLGFHTSTPVVKTKFSYIKMILGSLYPFTTIKKRFHWKPYEIISGKNSPNPDTIGAALYDSPAGLAAWILEKHSKYGYRFNSEITNEDYLIEMIDSLMLCWIGRSAVTPFRINYETNKADRSEEMRINSDKFACIPPMAALRFDDDVYYNTKWQLVGKYKNIVQISDYPHGAECPAMEVPEILVHDIKVAIMKFENYHSNSEIRKKWIYSDDSEISNTVFETFLF